MVGYGIDISMGAYDASGGLKTAILYQAPVKVCEEIDQVVGDKNFVTEGSIGDMAFLPLNSEWEFGRCRWQSQAKDMCRLSKQFPDVLFVLRGNGVDQWDEYWHNGKFEVKYAEIPPFDPDGMEDFYC